LYEEIAGTLGKMSPNREINGEIQQPADITHIDYTSLRLQFRNFLGNSDHSENNDRRRRRPDSMQIQDELDQYVSEPVTALNAVTGQLVNEPRAPAVGRPGWTLEL
jgi:hypothetical protein